MAQSFHWLDTPLGYVYTSSSSNNAWRTINAHTYITNLPNDVTGVIMLAANTNSDPEVDGDRIPIGWRANGSTDNNTGFMLLSQNIWFMCGVDAIGSFQVYGKASFRIFGYTTAGVVYHNAINITLNSAGSWQQFPALPAGAIGGIYTLKRSSGSTDFAIRKFNGGSNYFSGRLDVTGAGINSCVVECDAQGRVEANITNTSSTNIYRVGYITDGVVFNSPVQISNGSVWTNHTLPQSTGGIICYSIVNGGQSSSTGVRRYGSTLAATSKVISATEFSAGDTSGVIQSYVSNANATIYAIGYTEAVLPTTDYFFTTDITVGGTILPTRTAAFNRISAITASSTILASRAISLLRTTATTIANTITASRAVFYVRTATAVISNTIIAARQANLVRSTLTAIGHSITANRGRGYTMTADISIGGVVSGNRNLSAIRTTTVAGSSAITSSRRWSILRTASIEAGNIITASRIRGIVREAVITIGNTITASRVIAITREAVTEIRGIITSVMQYTGASAIYNFVAEITMGMSAKAERRLSITRKADTTTGSGITASRGLSIARQAVTSVSSAITANRALQIVREAAISCRGWITTLFGRNRRRKCIPGISAASDLTGSSSAADLTGSSVAIDVREV